MQRFTTTPSGRRLPLDLLVSENGAEIRLALSKEWTLEYRRLDLVLKFLVVRAPSSTGPKNVLGPECSVKLIAGSASRRLTDEERSAVARDVRGALRSHLMLPWAVPPEITAVHFRDAEFE
jgi:hypothetical protein